jgi:hypothetical protein
MCAKFNILAAKNKNKLALHKLLFTYKIFQDIFSFSMHLNPTIHMYARVNSDFLKEIDGACAVEIIFEMII